MPSLTEGKCSRAVPGRARATIVSIYRHKACFERVVGGSPNFDYFPPNGTSAAETLGHQPGSAATRISFKLAVLIGRRAWALGPSVIQ